MLSEFCSSYLVWTKVELEGSLGEDVKGRLKLETVSEQVDSSENVKAFNK
jgi:hypothetical protein